MNRISVAATFVLLEGLLIPFPTPALAQPLGTPPWEAVADAPSEPLVAEPAEADERAEDADEDGAPGEPPAAPPPANTAVDGADQGRSLGTGSSPEPMSDEPFRGVELLDGSRIAGRVIQQQPGAYVVVERPDGQREAAEWSRIARIDGKPPPAVPPPSAGSLIPPGFTPDSITRLRKDGKQASESLVGLFAPEDGSQLVGSIRSAQDLAEKLGLKRGAPMPATVLGPMVLMPFCFEMSRGTLGRFDGNGAFGATCKYLLVPVSVGLLVLAPFTGGDVEEKIDPGVHHVAASIYALDYQKKSALTGTFHREPSGSFAGNNLGYDLGYTYVHPELGFVGYGHVTLQQTSIASTRYLEVSSSFFKADAQAGWDLIRFATKGKPGYWSQHTAFFRVGPSMFHSWILSRDDGTPGAGAAIDNPLNNSIPLVTGVGYELAAEIDFRFPEIGGWSMGGVHFQVERGTYPSLGFPALDPREGAFVALIGFDDLRAGSTYTWQRLKLELELPLNYSRAGGLSVGGQLISYENDFGSGVDNRGVSVDYRLRF